MKIKLRQLSLTDGAEITEMLQEIGPSKNGFDNPDYDTPLGLYLEKYNKQSQGIDLPKGYVPQTIYRLYIENKIVGYGRLRPNLTESLIKIRGHIGYCIRPSARGKGYGNIILQELIKKAQEKGITKILLTCNPDNIPSRKIIEKNGGILENIEEKCRYWIDIK